MSSAALATRLAVLVLALASCSSDSGSGSGSASDDATPAGDEESASVVEDLSADEFCALLSAETIEQSLGVVVEGSEGTERGRAPVMRSPYFLSRECDYSSDLPALNTRLSTEWDEDDTDRDVVDRAFTDIVNETVGDYEEVADLGIVAGYGPNAMLDEADVASARLEVVLRAGDERLLLSVYTTGPATLDQLRPLAEELVAGLDF
ncbi:hypothetical protein [Jiangella endophytica]|uniref:hypothetical protein n=1 Tax=Jiangella endophytica TaxID=1623398 RepID=UPI000E34761A|nr:hypothetical protein [Jiangella endophytica]